MDNSIYIALSRQVALFRDLDVTANNLANSSTSGYNSEELIQVPFVVPAGNDQKMSFDNDIASYRRTEQGRMKTTGNPLDVAISGRGYFTIETPLGPRYTRAGDFQIDAEGTLTTSTGYPVLDESGQRVTFEQTDKNIIIGSYGNIGVDGEERAVLGIVTFANEQTMEQVGSGMFKSDVPPIPNPQDGTITVQHGVLETSNVEPVKQLTHLVDLQRSVGSTAKLIDTIYDLQRRTGQVLARQGNG